MATNIDKDREKLNQTYLKAWVSAFETTILKYAKVKKVLVADMVQDTKVMTSLIKDVKIK